MVNHPIGCGKPPSADETENWQHVVLDAHSGVKMCCEWGLNDVRHWRYTCQWNVLGNGRNIEGLFHKRCLVREGYIW